MNMDWQQVFILECAKELAKSCFPEGNYRIFWEDNVLHLYFKNVQESSTKLLVAFLKNEISNLPIEYKILEENDDFWSKI